MNHIRWARLSLDLVRGTHMPRVDAVRRIMEHLVSVRAPLVLITAPYGSKIASLVSDVESGLHTHFTPCPSDTVEGQPLQRRLTILTDTPGLTPHAAAQRLLEPRNGAASQPGPSQVMLIANVELLDQDSSVVIDVLVREHRVGMIMTCASGSRLSFRYSKPLQGPRGLRVDLPTFDEQDRHSLLGGVLGAPPTSALDDYLCAVTAGSPQELLTAALIGMDEGWIRTRGTHSAALHTPAWMDRRNTADIAAGLTEDLGADAVEILQRVAVQEQAPLRDFTEDPLTRDAVFWMVDAGLLAINDTHVHINRPILRHSLVLSSHRSQHSAPETASLALHRLSTGEELDEATALMAATHHLEQGLLEQARFLAGSLPKEDPRSRCLSASILVASGAPCSALKSLDGPADTPDTAALRAFIDSALRSSPDPEDESLDDVCPRIHLFDDYQPHHYLKTFAAPTAPSAGNGTSTQAPGAGLINTDLLITSTRAALDAYAAALAGDTDRARSSWRIATALPVAQLPIVAAGWVIERLGTAQILNSAGADVYPQHWFAGDSPERQLRYALNMQGLRLIRGLVCGEDTDILRSATEDLWEQFEAGLTTDSLSRRFMEALDHALGGARSAELAGPPELVPPGLTTTFRDATVDAVLMTGRLLRTPDSALADALDEAFQRTAHIPGIRETALRCLLLRRAAQMPEELLHSVIGYARRAQVREEVLNAAAQLTGDQKTRRRVLKSPVAGLPGLQFCSDTQPAPANPENQIESAAARLLSDRESQIVTHLLVGAGAADVAQDLSISVRTVHTHVRNVYRKLGVGSRTQLRARLSSARMPL